MGTLDSALTVFGNSLAQLQNFEKALIGITAICALIAIMAALVRYFAYEHLQDDQTKLTSRIMHVSGFLATILIVVQGGSAAFVNIMRKAGGGNTIGSEIEANSGTSFAPTGVTDGNPSYSSLGDLLNSKATGNGVDDTLKDIATKVNEGSKNSAASGSVNGTIEWNETNMGDSSVYAMLANGNLVKKNGKLYYTKNGKETLVWDDVSNLDDPGATDKIKKKVQEIKKNYESSGK